MILSKSGLRLAFLFLFFSVVFRFLLPSGDEPDYAVRAEEVVNGEHFVFSPYYWLQDIIKTIPINSGCEPDASPTSLWASLGDKDCSESLRDVAVRVLVFCVACLPLFIVIIFKKGISRFLSFNRSDYEGAEFFENRIDCLGVCLLMPGMVYFLGVFSNEQYSLCLSLLIFIVWERRLFVFILFALIAAIDFGNFIVVLYFFIIYSLFYRLNIFFGFRFLLAFSIVLIIGSAIIGFKLLDYISHIAIFQGRADAMSVRFAEVYVNKYPLIIRPAITFISASFMTPSGVKLPIVYILFIAVILHYSFSLFVERVKGKLKTPNALLFEGNSDSVVIISAATSVLSLILLFPDYSNAKYYMFLIPFIIHPIIGYYGFKKSHFFMIFVFVASAVNLSLYYL